MIVHPNDPRVHPDVTGPANVHIDPPDVAAFRALSLARRRGDRSRLRELISEMLAYGWVIYACEPRQAGRPVQ